MTTEKKPDTPETPAPAPVKSTINDLLGGLVSEKTIDEVTEIEQKVATPAATETEDGKDGKKPEKKVEKPVKPVVKKDEEEEEETPAVENEEEEEEQEIKDEDNPDFKGKSEEEIATLKKEVDKKKKKAAEKKEVELKNPFGITLKKKAGTETKIESYDQLPEVIKTKYGQELKDVKDFPKFFESVDKWRVAAQNVEKLTKEKDNAIAVFENLPPEMLEAVKLHYNNQDYMQAFKNTPKIDFSKPVDKHDKKTLVDTYFPGEFKDEDFTAETPTKELTIAIKSSEKQYVSDKTGREQRAAKEIEKANLQREAFTKSIDSSVEHLKKSFPDVLPDAETSIKNTLTSGELMAEFYNNDGTLRQDAAEKLMLAKHGKELFGQLVEAAQLRGETAALEEVVERTPSKKKPKPGTKGEEVRSDVTKMIDELIPLGLTSKKTY